MLFAFQLSSFLDKITGFSHLMHWMANEMDMKCDKESRLRCA